MLMKLANLVFRDIYEMAEILTKIFQYFDI